MIPFYFRGGDPRAPTYSGGTNEKIQKSRRILSGAVRRAAALFSEAAYSAYPVTEHQRTDVEKVLDETEHILYDKADWKQKLRLKYVECLHP